MSTPKKGGGVGTFKVGRRFTWRKRNNVKETVGISRRENRGCLGHNTEAATNVEVHQGGIKVFYLVGQASQDELLVVGGRWGRKKWFHLLGVLVNMVARRAGKKVDGSRRVQQGLEKQRAFFPAQGGTSKSRSPGLKQKGAIESGWDAKGGAICQDLDNPKTRDIRPKTGKRGRVGWPIAPG